MSSRSSDGRSHLLAIERHEDCSDRHPFLVGQQDACNLGTDRVTRAAYERFLEVLSEASRHIPKDWKADHPQIPWRQVADLGNHVRHSYQRIDLEILWNVYLHELDAIEHVIDQLIARAKSSQPGSERS